MPRAAVSYILTLPFSLSLSLSQYLYLSLSLSLSLSPCRSFSLFRACSFSIMYIGQDLCSTHGGVVRPRSVVGEGVEEGAWQDLPGSKVCRR